MKVKTKSGDDITLEFTDTFFETFQGTPEELQQIMQMIIEQVKDGSLFEQSEPVAEEPVTEDEYNEMLIQSKRRLQ
jgi:hypothetical protein